MNVQLFEHAVSAARGYARGVLRGEDDHEATRAELLRSIELRAGRDDEGEAVSRLVLAAFDVLMIDADPLPAVRLFTPWHEAHGATGAVLEQLLHFDRREYLDAISARGLEAVTMEEWRDMTSAGSGWARSHAEAFESSSDVTGWHVVEVTPGDVQAALIEWLELEA